MEDFACLKAQLPGRLLIVGTGCIAEGVLPLLWRHVSVHRDQVTLLGPELSGHTLAQKHGIAFHASALTPGNFARELGAFLKPHDVLLNLAIGVDSLDLLNWCQQHDVVYLDSNLEPWFGRRQNLADARVRALDWRGRGRQTAVIAHGANPGLITHLLKSALRILAPRASSWAEAANQLGLQILQISELDSHVGNKLPSQSEFANTWSARGLAGEFLSQSEVGWGGHELSPPKGSVAYGHGRGTTIHLPTVGGDTRVRSWSPSIGPFTGYLLAHYESSSLAELLTAPNQNVNARPTVFYAVMPCPAAESAVANLRSTDSLSPRTYRTMKEELCEGACELGVLMLGRNVGHWYGTRLTLATARQLAPDNNATSLQVAAGVVAGLVWALENPWRGVVEAEDMDHRRVLSLAAPYLGTLFGVNTTWRPDNENMLRFKDFVVDADRILPPEKGVC
jgi:homospermidine synthase